LKVAACPALALRWPRGLGPGGHHPHHRGPRGADGDLRADMNARFAQVETQLRELRQELKEEMRQTRSLLQEAIKARTA
jgi:hypothetical protein